ncbi:MAG: hypothetical protein R6W76_15110 [Caldilinea sp.]
MHGERCQASFAAGNVSCGGGSLLNADKGYNKKYTIKRPKNTAESRERIKMLPELVHTYQNHTLDSTRWNCYKPRSADIVISTSLKSGTTWTMEIVRQLIFLGQDMPQRHTTWLDNRWGPIDQEIALLEGQQHRRFITLILRKITGFLFWTCKIAGVLFWTCKIAGVLFPKSSQTFQ